MLLPRTVFCWSVWDFLCVRSHHILKMTVWLPSSYFDAFLKFLLTNCSGLVFQYYVERVVSVGTIFLFLHTEKETWRNFNVECELWFLLDGLNEIEAYSFYTQFVEGSYHDKLYLICQMLFPHLLKWSHMILICHSICVSHLLFPYLELSSHSKDKSHWSWWRIP